jgi:hypothetical protein
MTTFAMRGDYTTLNEKGMQSFQTHILLGHSRNLYSGEAMKGGCGGKSTTFHLITRREQGLLVFVNHIRRSARHRSSGNLLLIMVQSVEKTLSTPPAPAFSARKHPSVSNGTLESRLLGTQGR